MMDYEVFKNVMVTRIKDILPPLYEHCVVSVHQVSKINETKEAMILEVVFSDNRVVSPNVYLDDMYRAFKERNDIEEVLNLAATIIINYTSIQLLGDHLQDITDYREDIVLALINKEKNRELLETAPHREYLNLAVICRFAIEENDNTGYATALVTKDIQEELGLSDEELYRMAEENSRRKFKTKVHELSPDIKVMTTDAVIYGAVNLLRKDELKKVADKFNDDLIILPGSMHEIFTVRASKAEEMNMRALLGKEGSILEQDDEYLTDCIYYYERSSNNVEVWNG